MANLTWGTRLIGNLFRYAPEFSIANMTLEQIEQAQNPTGPPNPMADRITRMLVGSTVAGVTIMDQSINGPGGQLPLRIYTPDKAQAGPRPLIVHFHGGGWVLGNLQSSDWLASKVARDAGAVVVSVGYRLAPKHKFPAALDDCYAALEWAAREAASLGADADKIGLMGDSAGGNLAAVVCLLALERGGPAISHLALFYPVTDGSMSSQSYKVNKDAIILTAADMAAFYGHYLPDDTDPLDWRVSPLYAPDLSGFPSTIIIVAAHDPLHDEGIQFAEKLADAGVEVVLKEYPAMPHGFVSFPRFSRDAKPAVAEVTTAQRASLSG